MITCCLFTACCSIPGSVTALARLNPLPYSLVIFRVGTIICIISIYSSIMSSSGNNDSSSANWYNNYNWNDRTGNEASNNNPSTPAACVAAASGARVKIRIIKIESVKIESFVVNMVPASSSVPSSSSSVPPSQPQTSTHRSQN